MGTGSAEEPRAAPDAATELLLRFARAGHDAGYPTADLEEQVLALAGAFGLGDVEVSATPTLVEVSLGSFASQGSATLRVRPTAVDLDAIARLDDLVQDALEGQLDADGALVALGHVRDSPLRRPRPLVLAAYAVAGSALTPVLGGGWRAAVAAALVGLLVGAITLSTSRTARTEPMVAPIAAVAASFCAALLVRLGLDASADVVTLAALVTLLPGMTLTIGMRGWRPSTSSPVSPTRRAHSSSSSGSRSASRSATVASNWFGEVSGPAPSPAWLGCGSAPRSSRRSCLPSPCEPAPPTRS